MSEPNAGADSPADLPESTEDTQIDSDSDDCSPVSKRAKRAKDPEGHSQPYHCDVCDIALGDSIPENIAKHVSSKSHKQALARREQQRCTPTIERWFGSKVWPA